MYDILYNYVCEFVSTHLLFLDMIVGEIVPIINIDNCQTYINAKIKFSLKQKNHYAYC